MVASAAERLRRCKAAIAAAYLDVLPSASLGSVVLRDDQRRIVARARRALALHRGCLIGEEVGRGKTFVALSLASEWREPLVVAPASLRRTWALAMERAGVPCGFVSHEALSRGCTPPAGAGGLVVDESHHFRTTSTKRYDALCTLSMTRPLLLLSATPLQNRVRDLAAQVALFAGEAAFSMSADQLARHVIRGDSAPIARMPRVMPPAWVPLDIDDARVLRSILDLAPPARPLDGGDGGALRVIGLVRAWASSRAALQAMLRTRRRMAAALEQGVDAGRLPTRQEARAWHAADDVVQLGFAELLMGHAPLDASLNEVRKALEGERGSMEGLVAVLKETPDPDVSRVRALRAMRAEFPLQSIIAFSEYASTVTALFGMMRGDTGVGMLTAREARIASGRLTREELLTRFAPVAHGAPCPPVRERVTLLLATDLLSEGVNLQDANIVVHFDLPWNPARLAQRVGRVRRPGGAHTVHSFLLAPPAEAATLLHADARLRRKLAEAERAVGVGFDVLPALTPCSATPPPTPHDERLASASAEGVFVARLASWRRSESAHNPRGVDANGPNATQGVGPGDAVIFAGVTAPVRGWLAALDDGTLVGSLDGCPTDTGACVRQAAVFAEGIARDVQDTEVDTVLHLLNHWLEERQLAQVCGIDASQGGSLRQAVFSRLEQITRALSRHERAAHLPRIMHLRSALTKPMPLGAERALARSVANARTSDLSWLACATDIVGRLPALARRPAARRAVAVVILCAPAL